MGACGRNKTKQAPIGVCSSVGFKQRVYLINVLWEISSIDSSNIKVTRPKILSEVVLCMTILLHTVSLTHYATEYKQCTEQYQLKFSRFLRNWVWIVLSLSALISLANTVEICKQIIAITHEPQS